MPKHGAVLAARYIREALNVALTAAGGGWSGLLAPLLADVLYEWLQRRVGRLCVWWISRGERMPSLVAPNCITRFPMSRVRRVYAGIHHVGVMGRQTLY